MDNRRKGQLRRIIGIKPGEKIPEKYLRVVKMHEESEKKSRVVRGLTRGDIVMLVTIVDYADAPSATKPSGSVAEAPAPVPEAEPKVTEAKKKQKKAGI